MSLSADDPPKAHVDAAEKLVPNATVGEDSDVGSPKKFECDYRET